ncbi:calcium-binding protein [Hydrogenophaga sp. BPS33]|uniref:calcium-binding protein n=1 Tax=Hydrogenophaga sp. BPS33 TaxID=2651974 RepID=UPI00135B9C43|nr:calcium-binding protein [Hydrogenophaga sp. BPS33]
MTPNNIWTDFVQTLVWNPIWQYAGFNLWDKVNPTVNTHFRTSQQSGSPIILDLDGDGIEISRFNGGAITFDHDANGIRTGTAWAAADDGLLVLDRDGNGRIDSGRELFGDNTLLANGKRAADGYAALRELDGNADGVLDGGDAAFARLRVWRDLDQDGLSDEGELFSLGEMGLSQIGLNKNAFTQTLADGTRLDGRGSFTIQGQSRTYTDAWFAENPFYREFAEAIGISEDVAALPDMQGSGAVRDLREAAMLSEPLRLLLEQFSAASTRDAQRALIDPILQAWANTSDFATVTEWEASGRSVSYALNGMDAVNTALWKQRIAVLEAFNAQNYVALSTGTTQVSTGPYRQELLEQSYAALHASVYGALVMQTRLKPYLDSIELVIDEQGIRLDATALDARLNAAYALNEGDTILDLAHLIHVAQDVLEQAGYVAMDKLKLWMTALPAGSAVPAQVRDMGLGLFFGTAGDEMFTGTSGDDTVYGEAGHDTINAEGGSDVVFGGAGNDSINGAGGNDWIDGGDGNDAITDTLGVNTLRGGAGNDVLHGRGMFEGGQGDDALSASDSWSADTYIFNLGDGHDTITEWSVNQSIGYAGYEDTLQFGAGITAADVQLRRVGNDMVFWLNENDQITVKEWFSTDINRAYRFIEKVAFADGTVWNTAPLMAKTPQAYQAGEMGDVLRGWDGIDLIHGNGGNDTINGEGANDYLDGGDGNDNINAGEGSDVVFGGAGNDSINGAGGNDWIDGGDGNDAITDTAGANTLRGGAGNDVLHGRGVFEGGQGDDALSASDSWSADTYIFNLGDGHDTITEWSVNQFIGYAGYEDTLQFGPGITAADVQLRRVGNDMVFWLNENDQITVKEWFSTDINRAYRFIEKVAFADGTVWNTAPLMAKTPQAYQAGEMGDVLRGWDGIDLIHGNGGNDTINGEGANDYLDGGDGNDNINAGEGSDVVFGGAGNDSINGAGGNDWIDGGDGNDAITDTAGANTLRGGAGNDVLHGRGVFEGGQGDDALSASDSWSADTYIFNLGDGHDTITEWSVNQFIGYAGYEDTLQFGPGITAADVQLRRVGNDMVFWLNENDQITVKEWFSTDINRAYRFIERVAFADGAVWNTAPLMARTPQAYQAGEGAEVLRGWDGIDLIHGNGGNDTINGEGANDYLDGGDGNDNIHAGEGSDVVFGGAGNDSINGAGGNDWIDGGDGNDAITDTAGANTLRGGAGNDILHGRGVFEGGQGDDALSASDSWSADTYIFNLGDGHDTITEWSVNQSIGYAGYEDTLQFGPGITAADVQLRRVGNDMVFWLNENDQITVKEWFSTDINRAYRFIEKVAFADGTAWNTAPLMARMPQAYQAGEGAEVIRGWDGIDLIHGNGGNDTINGEGANDYLDGGDGNDNINAGEGSDVVFGGAGNDSINGAGGNDWIDGGDGNDAITDTAGANTLRGGVGNDTLHGRGMFEGGQGDDALSASDSWSADTYIFNLGDGRDTITEWGVNHSMGYAGYDDTLQFGQGIAHDQLWFSRDGNDLDVTLMGSSEGVVIKDWYASPYRQVEQFQAADNQVLLASQIDALVQAMAAFSPPPPGQTTLTPALQSALAPVIAANWT